LRILLNNIPDEGVDLDGVNVVELLESLLDLSLVGLDVNNEDEGVVLLDLLHGALGVERVDDDLVLIETWLVWDALAWELWSTGELEGLWLVEGRRETDLADLLGVDLITILTYCAMVEGIWCYLHP
jgi:hypothetical protein